MTISMTYALTLRAMNAERLHQIRTTAKPQRAADQGTTTCQRSGVCCWTRPCDLFPGDPEKIAAHLEMTPSELFRDHLVVDHLGDASGFRLLPRRADQDDIAGQYVPAERTYDIDTPCVFLDVEGGNVCRIHKVKPTGGARYHCTLTPAQIDALPAPGWTEDQLVALGWNGDTDP